MKIDTQLFELETFFSLKYPKNWLQAGRHTHSLFGEKVRGGLRRAVRTSDQQADQRQDAHSSRN